MVAQGRHLVFLAVPLLMLVVAVAAHGPLAAVLPEDQAAAVAVVLVEQVSRVRRERLTLAAVVVETAHL